MDLNKMPIFAALTRRMDWLSERQRVLAQNIANADTPGYRPHDLKQPSFREMLATERGGQGGKMRPSITMASHMGGAAPSGKFREEAQRKSYETAPSGNAVVLEEQLVKLAETQLEYGQAASLYRKHLGMIKTALGRRNS